MEIFNQHTEERGAPRLSDAMATAGSAAAGVGVLLISIDVWADHPGRGAAVAMFGALVLAGYLVLLLAPRSLRPAGITAIVVGVLGALGWWWLPGASSMADVRPFLILTVVAMIVCFVVPRSRGRAIFVVIVLLVLWLWAIAEIASPEEAYSIAPIPSPPANTVLSLSGFVTQSIEDLDQSDPLYPLAQACADGELGACDRLYFQAPFGSDFSEFGSTCGNTTGDRSGTCAEDLSAPPSFDFDDETENPLLFPSGPGFVTTDGDDKSFEIGFISVLFGLAYLAGMYVLDRRGQRGLATAFVVPALAALLEGSSVLGNAAGDAWVGGLLTLLAGVLIGTVGHVVGDRRFTTWTGGLFIGLGALTMGVDAADLEATISDGDSVKLAGPGLIVIAVGIAVVLMAYLASRLLTDPAPEPGEPELGDPMPGGDPQPGSGARAPQPVSAFAPPPDYSWNAPPPPAPADPPPPETPPPETPPPMVS